MRLRFFSDKAAGMYKMKKNKYIVIFLFLGVVGVATFAAYSMSQRRDFDTELRYNSRAMQEDITQKLDQHDITYRVDRDGFIWYRSLNEEIVKEIVREVERSHSPGLPNKSFSNAEHKKYFTELLRQGGIPYKVMQLDASGDDYLVWDWEFDDRVQEMIMEAYRKFGITKRPPKMAFYDPKEKELFLSLLKKENIPYRIVKSKVTSVINAQEEAVEYSWSDYKKVKAIREKVREIGRKSAVSRQN